MNEPNKNPNELKQIVALTRFKALNFVEDLQREGLPLAEALRQASVRPWPDEEGDYYAVRTLEDWWYAYQKGGFNALLPAPRSDQGKSRVLEAATAAWVLSHLPAHLLNRNKIPKRRSKCSMPIGNRPSRARCPPSVCSTGFYAAREWIAKVCAQAGWKAVPPRLSKRRMLMIYGWWTSLPAPRSQSTARP